MVAQERRCEISAMPEATEGSFPYALGMTMVLSPNGIASEQTAQTTKSSGSGKSAKTPINTKGMASNRISETA